MDATLRLELVNREGKDQLCLGRSLSQCPVHYGGFTRKFYDRTSDDNTLHEGSKDKSSATVEELSALDVESNCLGNVDKLW